MIAEQDERAGLDLRAAAPTAVSCSTNGFQEFIDFIP
jgi:hypothetical protein